MEQELLIFPRSRGHYSRIHCGDSHEKLWQSFILITLAIITFFEISYSDWEIAQKFEIW